MTLYRNRRFWLGTLIAATLFTSLLVYRVEFYHSSSKNISGKNQWSNKPVVTGESWMNIVQNSKKIGYTHRTLENFANGYKILEESVMKINTMGMAQEINVKSVSTTDMDFAVKTFDFKIASGSFDFALTGEIKENNMYVYSNNKTEKPVEIPLENRPYLTSGIIQATLASGLKKDEEMVLFVFDPSTLGQAPATIKVEESESIEVDGKMVTAQKVSLSLKGAKQLAWIDEKGDVLKEQGLLGITLTKTDREGALDGLPLQASDDLTHLVSVKANKTFDKPEQLTMLVARVSNLQTAAGIDLNTGRQIWKKSNEDKYNTHASKETSNISHIKDTKQNRETENISEGILTIKKESLEELPEKLDPEDIADINYRFKLSDIFVQSSDPRIRSFARKVTSPTDTPLDKVKKLVAWIQENIKRQPVVSLPNAISTLKNRKGDCNEHAALLAAFCRSIGIPAKIEAGMVYLKGRFYYHAWNAVFIGRWITVDALFNQIPADVTHIALLSGSQQMQLDLMGVIGKIQIEITDYRY